MDKIAVLITAAGSGARMGGGVDKLALPLKGKTVLACAAEAFVKSGLPDIFIVGRPAHEEYTRSLVPAHPIVFVEGGETRQESVLAGLRAIPPLFDYVLIHDGARPFVSGKVILSVIEKVKECHAAVPGVKIADTVAITEGEGLTGLLPREKLVGLQTPQGFSLPLIRKAHENAKAMGLTATDDSALVVALGKEVALVPGCPENRKITALEDYERAHGGVSEVRVGLGVDVHRLIEGRKLVLGGVHIPHHAGLLGHSDADVLTHAVMDALLGAMGLQDIGQHFPDTDPRFAGADSLVLLAQVVALLAEHGATPKQVDITLLLEKPKIAGYRVLMRQNLARVLGVSEERVNIKATTSEGLGFVGQELGASCQAVATITCTR